MFSRLILVCRYTWCTIAAYLAIAGFQLFLSYGCPFKMANRLPENQGSDERLKYASVER